MCPSVGGRFLKIEENSFGACLLVHSSETKLHRGPGLFCQISSWPFSPPVPSAHPIFQPDSGLWAGPYHNLTTFSCSCTLTPAFISFVWNALHHWWIILPTHSSGLLWIYSLHQAFPKASLFRLLQNFYLYRYSFCCSFVCLFLVHLIFFARPLSFLMLGPCFIHICFTCRC